VKLNGRQGRDHQVVVARFCQVIGKRVSELQRLLVLHQKHTAMDILAKHYSESKHLGPPLVSIGKFILKCEA
ncbi:hypothetical protein VIGAN_03141700, partial [Vigna angularis var. angularis]